MRRQIERRWQQTMANAPVGMALVDLDGHFTEINDRLAELLGYSREELLGKHVLELIYPPDVPAARDALAEAMAGHRETVSVERRHRHKDGRALWVFVRANMVAGADDRPGYLLCQFDPIGGERLGDRHLAHMALHDALTGLANRALLFDRLEQELTALPHRNDEVLAVLLVDLDNLKPTNDQYGHAAGDALLTTTAHELLNSVRAGDTVARLGGDEFVVLARMANLDTAEALRQRIARSLDTEIVASAQPLILRASVGLATTRNPAASPEALLDSADRDMYARKQDAAKYIERRGATGDEQ